MKLFSISSTLVLCFCFNTLNAQNARAVKIKTDSVISLFATTLKNQKYEFTEMIKNPDNYFEDYNNEIIGDTIQLGNFEYFKFYRTKHKDNFFMAEYYKGRIGQVFENEKYIYYFFDGKLLLTQSMLEKHGESLDDDSGVYYVKEERRLLFDRISNRPPLYITRDGEGNSDEFDINKIEFKQIASERIIYDKYTFEIIGEKIYNGKNDF